MMRAMHVHTSTCNTLDVSYARFGPRPRLDGLYPYDATEHILWPCLKASTAGPYDTCRARFMAVPRRVDGFPPRTHIKRVSFPLSDFLTCPSLPSPFQFQVGITQLSIKGIRCPSSHCQIVLISHVSCIPNLTVFLRVANSTLAMTWLEQSEHHQICKVETRRNETLSTVCNNV